MIQKLGQGQEVSGGKGREGVRVVGGNEGT
jgi:hypothetical protein